MLTTQARLAKRNKQPVKLVGDLYHIIDIKRVNGTSRMIATIKKIGLAEGKYEPIEVDIEYLERAQGAEEMKQLPLCVGIVCVTAIISVLLGIMEGD